MGTYNGWANYNTWNVALWIGNDEGLYNLARECKTFERFKAELREISAGTPIAIETPDGVAWNDSAIDTDEIEAMFEEDFGREASETMD